MQILDLECGYDRIAQYSKLNPAYYCDTCISIFFLSGDQTNHSHLQLSLDHLNPENYNYIIGYLKNYLKKMCL